MAMNNRVNRFVTVLLGINASLVAYHQEAWASMVCGWSFGVVGTIAFVVWVENSEGKE